MVRRWISLVVFVRCFLFLLRPLHTPRTTWSPSLNRGHFLRRRNLVCFSSFVGYYSTMLCPSIPCKIDHFSFTSYLTLFLPLLCVYHTQARHRVEMGTFLPNRYLSETITWSKSKLERVNNDAVSLCRGNDDIDVFKWISEKPPFLVKHRHECHDRQ